ncbi:MAG: MFS transporter [Hyphomicrobiales bacterium]|nr:MAG: MFS transporter [Hyphomicrobiales bacterium]
MLIASEFMPVSLLTPIATDLHATEGMAGQAISVSGLFAVVTSLFIATISSRFDRRKVLITLTAIMMLSLLMIAQAPSFSALMVARALLGITIGGFWSLATATVMRLVAREEVPRALGVLYMGNAVATAFAAPLGSYLGEAIGWRGVFWALVPMAVLNIAWQCISLPPMPPQGAIPASRVLGLLKRRHVRFAILGVMLSFGGAFSAFTYFRPFLDGYTHASILELTMLLLALGAAGFAGTPIATALLKGHLYRMLWAIPLAMGLVTLGLVGIGTFVWPVAVALAAWGALNAALPVAWFNWLAKEVADEPDAGGGLMVGAIQLSIMAGAGVGGLLLDYASITATFIGAAALLALAAFTAWKQDRLQPTT